MGMGTLLQSTVPTASCPHAGVQVDGQERLLRERGCESADGRWGQVGTAPATSAVQSATVSDGHQSHHGNPGCSGEVGPDTWFGPQNTGTGCPAALGLSLPNPTAGEKGCPLPARSQPAPSPLPDAPSPLHARSLLLPARSLFAPYSLPARFLPLPARSAPVGTW